jgi:hypothetical protein
MHLVQAISALRGKFGPQYVDCFGNMKSTQHEPWSEMSFVASSVLMQQVGSPFASGLLVQTCEKQQAETQMTDYHLIPPSHGHASCDP